MAVSNRPQNKTPNVPTTSIGPGGELHPTTTDLQLSLTTNDGLPIADDQNSLRQGARGPGLLEDHLLREKITHFDHERIPERVVHARGSGAHGYFQATKSCAHLTKAAFLQDPTKRTPVFARFSTVAGGSGSVDLARDVRGFSVKFYTEAGNFDLVGNNVPVFFIQDAVKFPDLVHAVKMEPDRGFPQAASAHDTFWDFVSLMPESVHMLLWLMSDRTIPRSLRMIEGFGVHTFRMIDARDTSTFVKFHWRPKLGTSSVTWDEAVTINGADNDYHRRDLWNAIARGHFPEWEFALQTFGEDVFGDLGIDILDATKLVPEELAPLEVVGRMVLDRNPDNFFAETEQVAFHPGHLVPGIDVSDDPLLQGRLFSYLDTQLTRLGSPNFHQIPINRPKCPMRNLQRDGHMRIDLPMGRVAYSPNSLDLASPRENPTLGFVSTPVGAPGLKGRFRPERFNDHYSQARMFFRSMSEVEQFHIMSAFAFELGKVETIAVRRRVLGHLAVVDPELAQGVERRLGMSGEAEPATPARAPVDLPLSPALSILRKAVPTLEGRSVGVLVSTGASAKSLAALRAALEGAGATMELVAPRVANIHDDEGALLSIQHAVAGAPSALFDAVAVIAGLPGVTELVQDPRAVRFVRSAYHHCKVIGHTVEATALLERAGVSEGPGVIPMDRSVSDYVKAAQGGRVWIRETLADPMRNPQPSDAALIRADGEGMLPPPGETDPLP